MAAAWSACHAMILISVHSIDHASYCRRVNASIAVNAVNALAARRHGGAKFTHVHHGYRATRDFSARHPRFLKRTEYRSDSNAMQTCAHNPPITEKIGKGFAPPAGQFIAVAGGTNLEPSQKCPVHPSRVAAL